MIAPIRTETCRNNTRECHTQFVTMLPQIEQQARHALRDLPTALREEHVEEVVANAYVAFVRLVEQGKQDVIYPTPLARYGVAQVRHGRLVGGSLNSKDVLSVYAQRKRGYLVERLNGCEEINGRWVEAVIEDHRTPVPDQVAFRIDYPAWLATLSRRRRRIAQALSLGHSTSEVARRFHLSPGRVSQLRGELRAAWLAFHGDQCDSEEASQENRGGNRGLSTAA